MSFGSSLYSPCYNKWKITRETSPIYSLSQSSQFPFEFHCALQLIIVCAPAPPPSAAGLLLYLSLTAIWQPQSSPTQALTPDPSPSISLELCSLFTVPVQKSLSCCLSLLHVWAVFSPSASRVIPAWPPWLHIAASRLPLQCLFHLCFHASPGKFLFSGSNPFSGVNFYFQLPGAFSFFCPELRHL